MTEKNISANELKQLLDTLKLHGFQQKSVSSRIGYDADGEMIGNALRGKSQKRLNEAYILIQQQFAAELQIEPPTTEIVTMKTIDAALKIQNEKLDLILKILQHD